MASSERKIERWLDRWRVLLGLEHWNFKVHFVSSYRADDGDCAADTNAQWQYQQATMRFYMPLLKPMDDDEVEAVVVHELVHVLVNPMESVCPEDKADQKELAVELVARALQRACKPA